MRFGGADRWSALTHHLGGFDHQPPERNDRHVAGADPFPGTIAYRAHRFPHGDILVRDAADTGEVALLHCSTILKIEIAAVARAVEISIDVDSPLQHVELTPRIGFDTGLVGAVPGDEVKD